MISFQTFAATFSRYCAPHVRPEAPQWTTLPTQRKSQREADHPDKDPSSEHVEAALLKLAHDLEQFIEEMMSRPTLDRFEDLPVELRYKIYEEYFLNNCRSLATREWPELDWTPVQDEKILKYRTYAPILLALCLVSKVLLVEVGVFLLSALTLTFIEPPPLMQFIQLAAPCRLPGLRIAHNIRRLKFLDANGAANAATIYVHGQRSRTFEPIFAEIANRATMTALNSCKGLHELDLHFNTPITGRFDHAPPVEPPVITAEDVVPYLVGFNVKPFLALKELRKLTIRGWSGRATICSPAPFDVDAAEFQNDTVSRPRPLLALAQKIQDALKARGQSVQTTTKLYWGKGQEEIQTVE